MPRTTKKTVKPTKKSTVAKTTRKQKAENAADALKARIANLNLSRSYTSLAYGVITVIVLFALIFAAIRIFTQENTPNISDNAVNTETETDGNTYVVQNGDTLWSISEKVYNDGFGWDQIAKANDITDPNNLEEGTSLTIPERDETAMDASPVVDEDTTVEPTAAVVSPTEAPQEQVQQPVANEITGGKYTVEKGDTLWDISVRAFGNGYRWTEIARMNNLANPDLIFSGNVLTLPAK